MPTLALALLLSIASAPELRVTCGGATVGYHFMGNPGQQFFYAGEVYRIPRSRWIELIADGPATTYRANGVELPLNVWPVDEFGFRNVPLPAAP